MRQCSVRCTANPDAVILTEVNDLLEHDLHLILRVACTERSEVLRIRIALANMVKRATPLVSETT